MAGKFSFSEQVDMLLVLGFCEGNCRRSIEERRKRFPNRVIPHREKFSNVERRARETGKFFSSTRERAIANRAQDKELILNTIEDEPHISTRNLSRQTGISQTSVHRVIRRNLLHPYHIQKLRPEQNFGIELQINVMSLETISGYWKSRLQFSTKNKFMPERKRTPKDTENHYVLVVVPE
ncbi:hypothetical protein NQ318_008725 [Aromia moschata]|uniref:DUF4817 domain-containing protein n=1 Tax=Aromia moschata TaxID=1265417 RepID=A0AAV8XAL6_9CUCU|nr:hypothetical protein NQ318_008725 [Aromia moschata]